MSTIQRWNEFEDWVEFYSNRELAHIGKKRYEALMNFGGPGSATPYHFYARVKTGAKQVITTVAVDQAEFTPRHRPVVIPGTPVGFRWVHFGFAKIQRNYHRVTITAPRGLAGLDRSELLAFARSQAENGGRVFYPHGSERAGTDPCRAHLACRPAADWLPDPRLGAKRICSGMLDLRTRSPNGICVGTRRSRIFRRVPASRH